MKGMLMRILYINLYKQKVDRMNKQEVYSELRRINNERLERLKKQHLNTMLFGFPTGCNYKTMAVVGYLQGERMDKCEGITLEHFAEVRYIKHSRNKINGNQYIHAVSDNGTILILKML